MKQHFFQLLIGAFLAVIILLLGNQAYETWRAKIPPVVNMGTQVLTPVVPRGGVLKFKTKFEVRRQCPTEIFQFLLKGDVAVYRFPIRASGFRAPGIYEIEIPVKIPIEPEPGAEKFWTDGEYTLREIITRYCEQGVTVDLSVPDLKFRIEGGPK